MSKKKKANKKTVKPVNNNPDSQNTKAKSGEKNRKAVPAKDKKTGAAAEKKWVRPALWVIIAVLALVLAFVILLWVGLANTTGQEDPTVSTMDTTVEINQQTGPVTGALEDISVDLGSGMRLTNVGSYTGAYVEDGSNEVVNGVLMVIITNTGADAIEFAQITLPTPTGDAEFHVSTLLPGSDIVLLEQSRMLYTGQENYAAATASAVALFQQPLQLHEDKLQIQILDGAINVTNISGEAITGDIVIYYKNAAADLYYGGVTYRVRIEGGMAADEIKQIMASHFSTSGSRIMFVTVG